jgi:hypothetical protein
MVVNIDNEGPKGIYLDKYVTAVQKDVFLEREIY